MNGPTAMAICAALIVAGCASSTLPAVDTLATDYRQLARDHVRDHFPEASNIRDAQIAPPRPPVGSGLVEAGQTEYWAVCLRTKAKGRLRIQCSSFATTKLWTPKTAWRRRPSAKGRSLSRSPRLSNDCDRRHTAN